MGDGYTIERHRHGVLVRGPIPVEVADAYTKTAWPKLIERWDSIDALFTEEEPSGRAPKCYRLMKECWEASR